MKKGEKENNREVLYRKTNGIKSVEEYVHKTQQELQKSNIKVEGDVKMLRNRIKTTVINIANIFLGTVKKKKRREWFNERCKKVIERRNNIP